MRSNRGDETLQARNSGLKTQVRSPRSDCRKLGPSRGALVFTALVVGLFSASALAAQPAGTLLVAGDSISVGVGVPKGQQRVRGYGPQLRQMLRGWVGRAYQGTGRPMTLSNIAVGGTTTVDLMQQLGDPVLVQKLTGTDIRVVTLTIGGNDLFRAYRSGVLNSCFVADGTADCEQATAAVLADIGARYREIVRTLRSLAPFADIMLIDQYNPFRKEGCGAESLWEAADRLLASWNAKVVAPTANAFGAYHVQIRQGFLDAKQAYHSQMAGDCLHPSAFGHRYIAQSVEKALLGY